MALPTLSGVATLFAPKRDADGFEAEFTKSGLTMTKVNLAFQKSVKDEYDQWVPKGKINVRGVAFGPVAEYIVDKLKSKDRVNITVNDVEFQTFQKNDGGEGYSIQGIIQSVGSPIQSRNKDGYSNGGGDYG